MHIVLGHAQTTFAMPAQVNPSRDGPARAPAGPHDLADRQLQYVFGVNALESRDEVGGVAVHAPGTIVAVVVGGATGYSAEECSMLLATASTMPSALVTAVSASADVASGQSPG